MSLSRHPNRPLLAVALGIALAGCATSDEPRAAALQAPAATADPRPALAPLLQAMLEPGHPGAAEQAIGSLPPAAGHASEPVRNRHDPTRVDTLHRLTFDGLSVDVYEASETGSRLLAAVTVRRLGDGIEGLRVGMPITELLGLLGRPDAETSHALVYRMAPAGTAPHSLTVASDGDVATALTWSAYLD